MFLFGFYAHVLCLRGPLGGTGTSYVCSHQQPHAFRYDRREPVASGKIRLAQLYLFCPGLPGAISDRTNAFFLHGLLGSSLLSQFTNLVLLNSGAPGRSRRLRGIHDTDFFLVSMHTFCACVYSQACKCLTLGSDKTFGTPVRSAGVLSLKQISKPGAPQLGRSWTLLGAPGRSKALMRVMRHNRSWVSVGP